MTKEEEKAYIAGGEYAWTRMMMMCRKELGSMGDMESDANCIYDGPSCCGCEHVELEPDEEPCISCRRNVNMPDCYKKRGE